jgi:hypothetical protein
MMEEQTLTLDAINARFNEELQRQVDGTLPAGHVYRLGVPGEILQSTGTPSLPIELTAKRLAEKSGEDNSHHHPFNILEIRNLPRAIQNPLAVFSYGDRTKAQNVITQISINDRNVLVGIHFNRIKDGIEINDIRGLYPKDNAEWLNWATQKDNSGNNKLLYADKKRIQDLISQQRTTLAEVGYLDLNTVAKVVQNFQNPKLPEEEVKKNIKKAVPSAALKQALDKVESMKSKETTKNQINNMKNTLTIALLLASAACGAQTHFPKNYNVDLGGGVNDAGNYTPVAAVDYTFNNVVRPVRPVQLRDG